MNVCAAGEEIINRERLMSKVNFAFLFSSGVSIDRSQTKSSNMFVKIYECLGTYENNYEEGLTWDCSGWRALTGDLINNFYLN